jgi:DNA modification methylase
MIILGDCLQELPKIESNSIDLIITDPPYLISRDSNFKQISDSTSKEMSTKYNISIDFGDWDKVELDFNYLFKEWFRILKKGGTLIVFYDVWKSNEIKESANIVGFKQPRVCAWTKTNPVPINSKTNYLSNATEYFFTFVKGGKPTFNSAYDNGFYKFPICHGKERLQHPTQKPLSLISQLIEKHSNSGDLVLDNFAGTGTVGEACIKLGRDYILIEKEETYFNMIGDRLNKSIIS